MKILIGTSGWQYKHWNGTFYPEGIKDSEKLNFLAKKFQTVEINSSFYRMPSAETFKHWYKNAPEGFIYSLKFPRYMTQMKKLIVDDTSKGYIRDFFKNSKNLKEHLGCVLIQLPPNFKCDEERLEAFLKFIFSYIKRIKYRSDLAVEFRNQTWFTDSVFAILQKYNVAVTISDTPSWPMTKKITADFTYIRFHGPGQLFGSSYTNRQMNNWAEFIQAQKGLKKIYVYFNNDINMYAIKNAGYLQNVMRETGNQ